MNSEINKFFAGTIAVAGFSLNKNKFGNQVLKALISKNTAVIPIHPQALSIYDRKCYKRLSEYDQPVESLYISMKPDKAQLVVNEAIDHGVTNIWFQQGEDFSSLAQKAREANINVIEKKCILMYAEPVKGIHAFHRFLSNLFSTSN